MMRAAVQATATERAQGSTCAPVGHLQNGPMQMRDKLPLYEQSIAGSLLAAREAVMNPIRPYLRNAGVSEQQWRVLRVLSDNGVLDSGAIARKALLFAPSVSRIIRDLLQRGLVTRQPDPSDARRTCISITPAGEQLVRETARHTKQLLDRYEDAFGAERLAALCEEAQRLAHCLRALATAEDGPDVSGLYQEDAPGS